MSDALWGGRDFHKGTGGRAEGTLPEEITGISIDSRTLKPGEAFFAITGDTHDGHRFVRNALSDSASIAVVAKARLNEIGYARPIVIVPDVLEALANLGRAARTRSHARVIAVTGSVGKTGSKEMLRLALSGEGEVHASVASFNNHWGVPLTLARFPKSAQFGIFEIGMNHADEITPLSKMVRPHIAVITNVEPVHLEFFPSVEAIADAKAEIFAGLEPGGIAVLNADNPQFERLAAQARAAGAEVRSFGAAPGADARLLTLGALPERSVVTARIMDTDIVYRIGAPGRHLVQNSLAVLLAAKLAGADVKNAAETLADFVPPAGRGQRHVLEIGGGRAILFDESYNANPASMRAAIQLLGGAPSNGRRIAVLGDMLELGEHSSNLHRELADALAQARIDLVFAAGPAMRSLYDVLPEERRGAWAETSAALEPLLLAEIRGGDAIMIKGSLGSRMGPIVAALTRRFAAADTVPV